MSLGKQIRDIQNIDIDVNQYFWISSQDIEGIRSKKQNIKKN